MAKKREKGHPLENLALISQIGIAMITPIIMGLYLGRWMDNKFNTQPIFLLLFIAMGVIAGFMNLFKIATKDTKR